MATLIDAKYVTIVSPLEAELDKLKEYLNDKNLMNINITKSITNKNILTFFKSLKEKQNLILFFGRTNSTEIIFQFLSTQFGLTNDATICFFRGTKICGFYMDVFDNKTIINLQSIINNKLECMICYQTSDQDRLAELTGCYQCSFTTCIPCREKNGNFCPQCKSFRLYVPNSEVH